MNADAFVGWLEFLTLHKLVEPLINANYSNTRVIDNLLDLMSNGLALDS